MKELHNSQYRLRKAIGILGMALPVLLLLNHDYLLSSMSHYYYTSAGVFFIGILVAFGLILITYQGYPCGDNKELLSDETTTTLAAICIFITVLVPTKSEGAMGVIYFGENTNYLFGHVNQIKSTIHLASAGLFLILLGYMCFSKFTLSPNIKKSKKLFYKICGLITWGSIGILIILSVIDAIFFKDNLNSYFPAYTFWFEMIAIWAFGIAWLVKGKFDRDLYTVLRRNNTTK